MASALMVVVTSIASATSGLCPAGGVLEQFLGLDLELLPPGYSANVETRYRLLRTVASQPASWAKSHRPGVVRTCSLAKSWLQRFLVSEGPNHS